MSGEGFDPAYFQELAALEKGHFWFENRNRLITWSLRRHFPRLRRFLEIGCGTGFVLQGVAQSFPHAELSGSEYFAPGLHFARARVPQAELFQLDARNLNPRTPYDVIGAFDVLEHIREDEQVLRRMADAVNPGGGILLTVPQHPELWSAFDNFSHHVRRYRKKELADKIRAAGLTVLDAVSFVFLPLPMILARRKKIESDYDGMAELKTAKPVNAAMHGVLRLERALIRLGARIPVGASLLIAAAKP